MRTAQLYVCALVLSGSAVLANSAEAATYYVATTGSDSAAGTKSSPFRTITYAYERAAAGDTIVVKSGVYYEAETMYGVRMSKNGMADRPITLRSEVKWGAVIDGRNLKDAPRFLVYIDGDYNVLEGFELRNSYKEGVTVRGSYNKILNNHIHHNGNLGDPNSIYGFSGIFSGEAANGTLYSGNYIHDNGRTGLVPNHRDHGMYLSGDNEIVINNISVRNMTHGLQVRGSATVSNLLVANNVFAHNGESGIMLYQAMSGITIRNNILHKNRRYAVETYKATGSGVIIDTNVAYGNVLGNFLMTNGGSNVGSTIGGNVTSDPLFVNDTSDFRLVSTSPAIDAGAMVAVVTTDFVGTSRPQGRAHDIGAHELGSAQLEPPAAPTSVRIVAD